MTKTGELEAWIASHSLWPHTLQGDNAVDVGQALTERANRLRLSFTSTWGRSNPAATSGDAHDRRPR